MSISFVTTQPMTLDQAIHLLKEIGCTVEPRYECDCCALVKDPDGNYFHLTDDIGSYTTLSINVASGEMTASQTEIHDGTPRVMGESYGRNDATRMVEALDMVSEYDDEYHEIMGAAALEEESEEG